MSETSDRNSQKTIRVGIPLFDAADLLDVTIPMEVLALSTDPRVELHLVAETLEPVTLKPRLQVSPTDSYESCPQLDVLVVPGGEGLTPKLSDRRLIRFLQTQGRDARWITAICAGSLLLGAAGLLDGHVATTHWASLPALELFPQVQVASGHPRYVISRDRMTTGGVTSGLDMSVALLALLAGEQPARNAELLLEYAPEPPYGVGHPDRADPVTRTQTGRWLRPLVEERIQAIRELLP